MLFDFDCALSCACAIRLSGSLFWAEQKLDWMSERSDWVIVLLSIYFFICYNFIDIFKIEFYRDSFWSILVNHNREFYCQYSPKKLIGEKSSTRTCTVPVGSLYQCLVFFFFIELNYSSNQVAQLSPNILFCLILAIISTRDYSRVAIYGLGFVHSIRYKFNEFELEKLIYLINGSNSI